MGRVARLRTVLAVALVVLLGMAYAAWRHLDSPSPGAALPGTTSKGNQSPSAASPTAREVRSSGPVTLSEKEIDSILAAVAPARPDLFYELTVDRFANGDPSNDDPAVSRGLLDRSKGRFKVEYAHAGRSFDPDDGVAELGRDGDRAMRVTRRARKYAR